MQWDIRLNQKLLTLKMKCQSEVYKKVGDFLWYWNWEMNCVCTIKNHAVIRSVLFHRTPLSYLNYFMLRLQVFEGNFNFFGL
jgi:hypothetical protein